MEVTVKNHWVYQGLIKCATTDEHGRTRIEVVTSVNDWPEWRLFIEASTRPPTRNQHMQRRS